MSLRRREDDMPNKKKEITLEELKKQNEELKLQNLRLQVEIEYLKKLDALVTERKRKESKK